MIWALAGIAYAALYAVGVTLLGSGPDARLVLGDVAMLLPPLAPLVVIWQRRRQWSGRQAVFFAAIAAWAALWLVGQIFWAIDELALHHPLPWFSWYLLLQLCGSALPLVALVAWPHRGTRVETAVTAAIDMIVLVFLIGFLYWSLIIAPGVDPANAGVALRSLAIIGPSVRAACAIGLLAASFTAGTTAWAAVYRRLAGGMVVAFVILIALSIATIRGKYQSGSLGDIGWMLPFFFAAWAAAEAPASAAESRSILGAPVRYASPLLLYLVLVTIAVVGYGLRSVMPLGDRVDRLRDIATAFTLIGAIALVMVRLRLEQHAVERANDRVRLLATACEHAGELILVTHGRRIEYANDAFCKAIGYSREELAAFAPEQFIAPESRGDVEPLRDRLRSRHIVRATTMMLRRDATTFPAAWSAAPIVDAHGRIQYVVAVVRDMTEDVRLREQVVRSERLSAIGELVSGVAHEMNNPLQSIIGTLDVLLHQQPADPTTRTDLERARREAGRAGRIVRNLLTFARRSPDERLLVDLNEIVQGAVNVRAYELEMAGIAILEEYGTNLPLVLANREAIQQIVANLIVNAQQAMAGRKGSLTVRTFVSGGSAALEVTDDGPGVAPHIASRIFEPFVTTKPDVTGTGLGLSLSFGIAHAHGGTLELVPSDSGACFRLLLPGAGYPGPAELP